MCKAKKPDKPKDPKKPQYLHNPYLDSAVGGSGMLDQLRTGRSSLRIDLAGSPSAAPSPVNPPPAPADEALTALNRPNSIYGSMFTSRYNLGFNIR